MREDIRCAWRALSTSRTFSAVALGVIAVGIGATTAIFSVVDAVVLRGLPFDEHDRLVAVQDHDMRRPTGGVTTPQAFLDWQRMQASFTHLAGYAAWNPWTRNERGEPYDTRGFRVTSNFFDTLRIRPIIGRTFAADDDVAGGPRPAVISYGFWQKRFGGSADAIGASLELNEQPWEVIGVLPPGFSYPVASSNPADVFVPAAFTANERTRAKLRLYAWTAVGRLRPGISTAQAAADMERITAALEQEHPAWAPGRQTRVIPLHEHLVGRVRSWMLMLLGAVALVLLMACANVANLLLARSTMRGREIGVRAALGAARGRLVRMLLVEGLMLSLIGAALGVALAWAGIDVIRALMPPGIPRVADISIDLRVLGATAAMAVVTGVLFAVVPAMKFSRPDLVTALRESGRSATAAAGTDRIRSVIVVAEVALAVVLLVGAGLFTASFVRLMKIDTGIDYENVLALNVAARIGPGGQADGRNQGRAYVEAMLDAVSAVPGVEKAGAVTGGAPLSQSRASVNLQVPGLELTGDDASIEVQSISPDYLQTLRVPLRSGRYLLPTDIDGTSPVVVINETAARKYFPGGSAIGQRMIFATTERTVVGVVGDIRQRGPEQPVNQAAFMPIGQTSVTSATLVMRASAAPLAVLPAVKAAIWSVNKDQRLSGDLVTLEGYMARLTAQRRFNMALLVFMGIVGLVIAAAGIYGVMAYIVTQRTGEIGIRTALGATPRIVLRMILAQSAGLMAAGFATGIVAAWWLSGLVRQFLFEVEPHDPAVIGVALGVLGMAGLIASGVPARRAARIDPLTAMRQE